MAWTQSDYAAFLAKQRGTKNKRVGPCPELQNREDGDIQEAQAGRALPVGLHGSRAQALDGASHPKFRISIDFLVADRRRRDADGMLSTILDCLVHAQGRLAPVDTGDQRQGSQGSKE